MLTCVQMQFNGPSMEIGRLLSKLDREREGQTWNK